jgi:hypothetical protein
MLAIFGNPVEEVYILSDVDCEGQCLEVVIRSDRDIST